MSSAKALKKKIAKDYAKEMETAFAKKAEKEFGGTEIAELAKTISEAYGTDYSLKDIEAALDALFKKQVRDNVLMHGKRFDGRKIDESALPRIRIISSPCPLLIVQSSTLASSSHVRP